MNAVYVQKDGEWHGPFSREALLSMLGTGAIAWETPCRHGSSDRVEKLEHFINRSAAPNNRGLLQTRLIGVIVSALSIVLGFLVLLLRRR